MNSVFSLIFIIWMKAIYNKIWKRKDLRRVVYSLKDTKQRKKSDCIHLTCCLEGGRWYRWSPVMSVKNKLKCKLAKLPSFSSLGVSLTPPYLPVMKVNPPLLSHNSLQMKSHCYVSKNHLYQLWWGQWCHNLLSTYYVLGLVFYTNHFINSQNSTKRGIYSPFFYRWRTWERKSLGYLTYQGNSKGTMWNCLGNTTIILSQFITLF